MTINKYHFYTVSSKSIGLSGSYTEFDRKEEHVLRSRLYDVGDPSISLCYILLDAVYAGRYTNLDHQSVKLSGVFIHDTRAPSTTAQYAFDPINTLGSNRDREIA